MISATQEETATAAVRVSERGARVVQLSSSRFEHTTINGEHTSEHTLYPEERGERALCFVRAILDSSTYFVNFFHLTP